MKKKIAKSIYELLSLYKKHEIPDELSEGVEFALTTNFLMTRHEATKLQGFTLMTKKWTKPLANYLKGKRVIELFAGTGSLTKVLQDEGVDIKATDNYSWCEDDEVNFYNKEMFWIDIEKLDCVKAIEKYNDVDYYIVSWCPYKSEDSVKALETMRKVNPNAIMIHIGEGEDGCTDCDKFFEIEQEIKDEVFEKTVANNFQRYFGIHDEIRLIKLERI